MTNPILTVPHAPLSRNRSTNSISRILSPFVRLGQKSKPFSLVGKLSRSTGNLLDPRGDSEILGHLTDDSDSIYSARSTRSGLVALWKRGDRAEMVNNQTAFEDASLGVPESSSKGEPVVPIQYATHTGSDVSPAASRCRSVSVYSDGTSRSLTPTLDAHKTPLGSTQGSQAFTRSPVTPTRRTPAVAVSLPPLPLLSPMKFDKLPFNDSNDVFGLFNGLRDTSPVSLDQSQNETPESWNNTVSSPTPSSSTIQDTPPPALSPRSPSTSTSSNEDYCQRPECLKLRAENAKLKQLLEQMAVGSASYDENEEAPIIASQKVKAVHVKSRSIGRGDDRTEIVWEIEALSDIGEKTETSIRSES